MSAVVEESVALDDGEWERRRGGVYVWRPQLRVVNHPATFNPNLIACGACGATITQACRTRSGNPTIPHAARLVSRRCPCGARLATRKAYCEPCRAAARERTYRLREQRKPTWMRRAVTSTNVATAKGIRADPWDNGGGPNRGVCAPRQGPDHLLELTERG